MQKFSEVLEAIKQTKRVGIDHLNKLKPMDFLKLINMFKDDMNGKISDRNASITLKVDGFGLRFGMDKAGDFFLESSNSGPQFKSKAFSDYTKGKKGFVDKISIAYDEVFDSLKSNKDLQKILMDNNTESGIKIITECLYNPIGKKDKKKIKFVAIEYDLAKLGNVATIVLIKAQDGDENPLPDSILNKIKKISSKDYLFTDPKTSINNVDLSIEIDDTLKFAAKYPDLEKRVLSRKHADRELKNMIKDTLVMYQDKMAAKLLKAVTSGKFSDQFEGVVISLLNGKVFKVIHKDFKNAIKHRPKG